MAQQTITLTPVGGDPMPIPWASITTIEAAEEGGAYVTVEGPMRLVGGVPTPSIVHVEESADRIQELINVARAN